MILTFVILAVTILLLVFSPLRSDLVALLALLALFLSGTLDLQQSLSGFSDPTVIMIAALFVIGDGLSRTGVTAWLGQQLFRVAGNSELRLLIVLMAGTAVLSAFISNTGTVATLLPAAVAAAWAIKSLPTKFLMPLALAANVGGLLTLTGTPPNIVVSNTLVEAGLDPFGFFEFSLIGLPLLMATLAYMVLAGRRLLPIRPSSDRPVELADSVEQLVDAYALEGNLFRLRVRRGSKLVGQTLEQAGLGRDYGLSVVQIVHSAKKSDGGLALEPQRVRDSLERLRPDESAIPGPETKIQVDDVLLVKGESDSIRRATLRFNLGIQPVETADVQEPKTLLSHEVGLTEVLITRGSALIGRSLAEGHFAEKYDVHVLGIWRRDKSIDQRTATLAFGDTLLVRGTWQAIGVLSNERRNFVVLGSPEALSRQIVEPSRDAAVAILALLTMIALMVSGLVPAVMAAIIAAVIMVLGGCLTMGQAYRAISWQSVVLIAAMIPISIALQESGGAEFLANGLVNTLGTAGPHFLLAGIFVLTSAFSQIISNTATTVLVAPIVLRAAFDLGLSPDPLMMMVAVSASTAFLTPIGTSANIMVLTPGNYRFADFVRVGFPLVAIFLVISLTLVPLIWPL